MARADRNPHWARDLQWVLFGMRAMPDEHGVSSAERVFGQPIALPAEFFPPSSDAEDLALADLRRTVSTYAELPSRPQPPRSLHLPPDLFMSPTVFVRVDAVKQPLQRPYEGPFRVGNIVSTRRRSSWK